MQRELLPKETILKNRYRIVGIIAKGGMGAVYRAFDQEQQKPTAIKENYFVTKEGSSQFKTEADVLRRLRHPGLPSVTEDFTENERQYLVMELIEGQDLAQIVKRNGPLSQEQALEYMVQVCRIVAYLHRQNIIHRDIKPQNIKITHKGQALLVDFGIAKIAEDGGHTALGAKAVTEGYSPPEQYSGHTDPRSDIYALGATLYTLLTGQKPPASTKRYTETQAFVPPEKINTQLSPALSRAIMHAMELRSADRPASVAHWQETLEHIQRGNSPISFVKPQPTSESVSQSDRTPPPSPVGWKWIGLAAVSFIVIGSILFLTTFDNENVRADSSLPIITSTGVENAETLITPTATISTANEFNLVATATSIATATATATPPETAGEPTGIATGNVPIYDSPSNNAGILDRLTSGGQIRIVSRTNDNQWLEVAEPAGWVMARFIEMDGSLAAVPVSTVALPTPTPTSPPTATLTPTPALVGPIPLRLGGGCGFYTLRAGGNQWFTFSSGENNTATVTAFIQNETRVEMFVYNQSQIVNGQLPANPDSGVDHMALLPAGNGRDRDENTKDIVWAGGVVPHTQYYIRIANRSPNTINYALAPSDAFGCP
ncbi:MAG: serine/threonine protein kinase [Anaerolineae bacterium]|nr:serine/threonine protein kinase [Anaerolineae bacterium]